MKKILLTSCGTTSENLKNRTKELFDKDASQMKVLYITVAADVEKTDPSWMQEEFDEFLELGIKSENVTEYKMNYEISVKDFDLIYMMGGNTFYLLKKIRKTAFDKKIIEAIENGIIYLGSSAGTNIVGSSVELALPYDDNDGYVTDFTGLKLLDGMTIPHANQKRALVNKQIEDNVGNKVYPIEDGKAILIIDDKIELI